MHVLESLDVSASMVHLICRMDNHKAEVISRCATCGYALHVAPNYWFGVANQFWSYIYIVPIIYSQYIMFVMLGI